MVSKAIRASAITAVLGLALLATQSASAHQGASEQNTPVPVVVLPAPPPAMPPPPLPLPLSVADGQAIEQALMAAPELAFPAGLQGGPDALANPNSDVRASADAAFTKAAVTLAEDEHGLLPDPAAIDPNWALRAPYDAAADFAAARAQGDIPAWAQGLARRNPIYTGLLAAQRRYRAIRARGGWQALPEGLTLGRGAKGKEVLRLRVRLAAEGYGDADKGNPDFDRELAAQVADFQTRHGLQPSGVLNAATVAALNVPVEARLKTLAANLERERWLPDQAPPDRIVADVAAAEVTLYDDDKPALVMRSIVGEPTRPTPLFASHVASIEFNPAWHVPTDIAKAELWPKEERAHGYLAKHGFSVVNGVLVQHAGPTSSLGRVKFDMPNPFSVYLHDTPGRALFAVDARGRSHGCVRLEKPNDLAVALLSGQGWTLEKVNDAIAKGDTRWVRPKTTVPVFLVYRTADAPDDGPAIFRPDLYGWDDKLNAALAAAPR